MVYKPVELERKVCPICGTAFDGDGRTIYDREECAEKATRMKQQAYMETTTEKRRAYQREYYKTHKKQGAKASRLYAQKNALYRKAYLRLIKQLGVKDEVREQHPEMFKNKPRNII